MKNNILFSLPGNEELSAKLSIILNFELGNLVLRKFPDGETYIRILSNVKDKNVFFICTFHQPDSKLLPVYFLSKGAKSLGAKKVFLIAPYLAYMRQDKIFNAGEAVTSIYFGQLISQFAEGLVTIDPHLHRIRPLSNVYHIPCSVIHAAGEISKWIIENVYNPLLLGPDEESMQWVSEVAKNAGAPFIILKKNRRGDKDVEVSVPDVSKFKHATPVLIDDIIATARTMMATVKLLKDKGMKPPICIGVHAVFAGNAYEELLDCGVDRIVTCNTIHHPSNIIDLSVILAEGIEKLLHEERGNHKKEE
ncbi:MAG: ribose-phosphate pyrophosphokinase [Aequorivita sp.]